jgi:hypothetical protein
VQKKTVSSILETVIESERGNDRRSQPFPYAGIIRIRFEGCYLSPEIRAPLTAAIGEIILADPDPPCQTQDFLSQGLATLFTNILKLLNCP